MDIPGVIPGVIPAVIPAVILTVIPVPQKLQQIRDICKDYILSGHVFKKCKDIYGNVYIVVLCKTQQTKDNEKRSGVVNLWTAKFRADSLIPVLFINFETLNTDCDQIKHSFFKPSTDFNFNLNLNLVEIPTVYKKGYIVKPDHYDENINNICTNGIHYFKSLEPAYYYNINTDDRYYTGYCVGYYASGMIKETAWYLGGKYNGFYVSYHESGNVKASGSYTSGMKNSIWIENYNDNGLVRTIDYT